MSCLDFSCLGCVFSLHSTVPLLDTTVLVFFFGEDTPSPPGGGVRAPFPPSRGEKVLSSLAREERRGPLLFGGGARGVAPRVAGLALGKSSHRAWTSPGTRRASYSRAVGT